MKTQYLECVWDPDCLFNGWGSEGGKLQVSESGIDREWRGILGRECSGGSRVESITANYAILAWVHAVGTLLNLPPQSGFKG